jgi:hypothetical protein
VALAFLPAALTLPLCSADPPQPQYSEGLLKNAATLKKTIPVQLVYTIFFQEWAAREKFADQMEKKGNRAGALDARDRARQVMWISAQQYPPIRATALECAADLSNIDTLERSVMQTLAGQPRQTPGGRPPELVELDNQRIASIGRALTAMQETLGPQAFAVADYWIYLHISGGIRRTNQEGGR